MNKPLCVYWENKKKKGICGKEEHDYKCCLCGFNPAENERRNSIELSSLPNGLKGKIIKRSVLNE